MVFSEQLAHAPGKLNLAPTFEENLLHQFDLIELLRNPPNRHCERSEAIHKPWMAASATPPRHDDISGYARALL